MIKLNDYLNEFNVRPHASFGNLAVIQTYLASDRASADYTDKKEESLDILREAVFFGHLNIVEFLLQDEYIAAFIDIGVLYKAVSKRHIGVVQALLENSNLDPSDGDNYILHKAIEKGQVDVVKLLLRDCRVQARVVNGGNLWRNASQHDVEMVKLLLSYNYIDPSADDNSAICNAAYNGNLEIVQLLLGDPRVDPSARDNAAICLAAKYGNADVVEVLLKDTRVNPTAQDNEPLILAAVQSRSKVVDLLSRDSRIASSVGEAPALLDERLVLGLIKSGNFSALEVLLANKIISDPSHGDNALLRFAAVKGQYEAVKTLLKDARVNPTADNNYALFWSIIQGHAKVAKLLINDHRVNPGAANNTAMRLALETKQWDVLSCLAKHLCCYPVPVDITSKIKDKINVHYVGMSMKDLGELIAVHAARYEEAVAAMTKVMHRYLWATGTGFYYKKALHSWREQNRVSL